MKNFLQEGECITVLAPRDVKSGEGVKVGDLFGVATNDAASGTAVVIKRRGVVELTKLEAQAWAVGAKVYWDDTNFRCTTVATGNKLIGAAVVAAANPSNDGAVLLDGVIR